jgi:hypothetical protein
MKKHIKLKGRIKTYLNFTIYLGALLCVVAIAASLADATAGVIVAIFTLFYFLPQKSLYMRNEK